MLASISVIQWVDVDDELPPRGLDVLLACADGVQQGCRRGESFRSYLRHNEPVFDVSHWARLPAHPLNEPDAPPAAVPLHRSSPARPQAGRPV